MSAMFLSKPLLQVGSYLLLILGLTLAIRLINHRWPTPVLLGVVVAGSYQVWRKERAMEERTRREQLQRAEQARRGKYGARLFRL